MFWRNFWVVGFGLKPSRRPRECTMTHGKQTYKQFQKKLSLFQAVMYSMGIYMFEAGHCFWLKQHLLCPASNAFSKVKYEGSLLVRFHCCHFPSSMDMLSCVKSCESCCCGCSRDMPLKLLMQMVLPPICASYAYGLQQAEHKRGHSIDNEAH